MMAERKDQVVSHLSIFFASVMWGLSAPVGKVVMNHGMSGLQLATFRFVGAAVCFWIASLFMKQERVSLRDLLRLAIAGLLACGFNQALYTVGLSMTSPVNATIIITTMPIFTMVLAFLFLREPITWKKAVGILFGATGAITIILSSHSDKDAAAGNVLGDVIVLTAQLCFASYLTAFKDVIRRYSGVTCMKWMFLSSVIFIAPFSSLSFRTFRWTGHDPAFWCGVFYVVFGATFVAYFLLMFAQKMLRPTVVSIYNYVQPIVACIVSIVVGVGIFGPLQGMAVVLVFSGVWLVTQSKSRAQQLQEEALKRGRE